MSEFHDTPLWVHFADLTVTMAVLIGAIGILRGIISSLT